MLRESLKISSPLALISREVPRFHGGSLWYTTLAKETDSFPSLFGIVLLVKVLMEISIFLGISTADSDSIGHNKVFGSRTMVSLAALVG